MKKIEAAVKILDILQKEYPDARVTLDFKNPLQLLMATILAAQCTDERVNLVTKNLFKKYRQASDYARADLKTLEGKIRSTGFFRNKAANLVACARALVAHHGGEVPRVMSDLVALPGVGRKTANVILGNAFAVPGMVVDTHVGRVARRLGWAQCHQPERVERELCTLLPRGRWTQTSHVLIWHGRRCCRAQTAHCSICPVQNRCPQVGVKRAK